MTNNITLKSQGLLGEQLQSEIKHIQTDQAPYPDRALNDVLSFDENIGRVLEAMNGDARFGVFDFTPKEEIYKIPIGTILDRMEYEFFDALRVSKDVPFAVMNKNRKKIEGWKGIYLSDDRLYKIYHSRESPAAHEMYLNDWSHHKSYATPYTIMIKVLLQDPQSSDQIANTSYVNAVYIFEQGLYLKLKRDQASKEKAIQATDILRAHITGFTLGPPEVSSISGSFVMDRLIINPALFRGVLVQPHSIGFPRPLFYNPFLWVVERKESMALRSQFILNFRMGDVQAKVVISEKITESSNVFYTKQRPVKFREGTTHNQITISEVKSREHASLVRDIVASVFYLYGEPQEVQTPQGPTITSRSNNWADVYNYFLQKRSYVGAAFGPTMIISVAAILDIKKNIMQLRSVDPTFYGCIETAKPQSKGDRQAIAVTIARNPTPGEKSWTDVLWETLLDIYQNDPPDAHRQIIRYPFIFSNPTTEEYKRRPVTIIDPYFLVARPGSPYFKPKIIQDPRGCNGTYHPFLMSCSKSQFVQTPISNAKDPMLAQFQALVDLNTVYQLTLLDKERSGRGDYKISTIKILQVGTTGTIPDQVAQVLRREILGSKVSETGPELIFERQGSPKTPDNLLHVLMENTTFHASFRTTYVSQSAELRQESVNRARKYIADSTNWNLGRQELFDLEPSEAKALFLNPATPIDSKLFRTVLERFFNVFLLIIHYDRMKSTVEIPRHRFFHLSNVHRDNRQTMVIFKHRGPEASRSSYPQYELIKCTVKNGPGQAIAPLEWNFKQMRTIFDRAAQCVDTSFVTALRLNENVFQTGTIVKNNAQVRPHIYNLFTPTDILLQYIDGAGKLRAIVHKYHSPQYPNTDITIASEPLFPLDIECFDDPLVMRALVAKGLNPLRYLEAQDFDLALEFLASKGVKQESLVYRLEAEQLVKEVGEEEVPVTKPGHKDGKTKMVGLTAGQVDQTKQMSVMDRIMTKTLTPKPNPEPTPSPEPTKVPKRTITVTRKNRIDRLAIGIWFKIGDVQFYIATKPGRPPTTNFSVDDSAFFDVSPDEIIYRQHDYYEKIANIMVQLIRNLYIYSRMDDPVKFMEFYTDLDRGVVYDIRGARRRLPGTRDFLQALRGYQEFYPSFFSDTAIIVQAASTSPPNAEGLTQQIPEISFHKIMLDSDQTRAAMLQHLKIVQRLKEDIMGASGSKFAVLEANQSPNGNRLVAYEISKFFIASGAPIPATIGISDDVIRLVPRMDKFFNRPDYILEFYAYPSDFVVRGPDQHIFMSEDEIKQYQDLLEMEKTSRVVSAPLPNDIQNRKAPLYYVGSDGSLYILQNVVGGSLHRAQNLIAAWESERVNLGYFADEWKGAGMDVPIIDARNIAALDKGNFFMLVHYGRQNYGALLKLDGGVMFQ